MDCVEHDAPKFVVASAAQAAHFDQARRSPRQQFRPSVSRDSSPESALAPARSGMMATFIPVPTPVLARVAETAVAAVIDAPVRVAVARKPVATARTGIARAMDAAMLKSCSTPPD